MSACSCKGLIPLVILDEETVDHGCYIKTVLCVALKYENEVFDDNWFFEQDGANLHRDHLKEEWFRGNFSSLIDKDCWSRDSPNLNLLDYSIWDELINVINWNKVRSKTTLTKSSPIIWSENGRIRLKYDM